MNQTSNFRNFETMESGKNQKIRQGVLLLAALLIINVLGYFLANKYFNKNEITENTKIEKPLHSGLQSPNVLSGSLVDISLWLFEAVRSK